MTGQPCVFFSPLCPPDMGEEVSLPGQSDRGEPLGQKFFMWFVPFPRTPQLTHDVLVASLYVC